MRHGLRPASLLALLKDRKWRDREGKMEGAIAGVVRSAEDLVERETDGFGEGDAELDSSKGKEMQSWTRRRDRWREAEMDGDKGTKEME